MNFKFGKKILLTIALVFSLSSHVYADSSTIANITVSEQSISIEGIPGFSNVLLKVVGPDGFYVENFLGNTKISMVIDDLSSLKNGRYKYELTATNNQQNVNTNKRNYNNGRANRSKVPTAKVSQNGTFLIKDGYVITTDKRIRNTRMMPEGADNDEA